MILFLSCFVSFLRQFHCAAQAGLELSEPPTSASLVPKLPAWAITPNLDFTLHFLIQLEVRRQGFLMGPFKGLDTGQQGVHHSNFSRACSPSCCCFNLWVIAIIWMVGVSSHYLCSQNGKRKMRKDIKEQYNPEPEMVSITSAPLWVLKPNYLAIPNWQHRETGRVIQLERNVLNDRYRINLGINSSASHKFSSSFSPKLHLMPIWR